MIPYDYQAEAVDVTVSSLRERNQALVIMATGLGKTFVAASTFKSLRSRETHIRNLVLCHDTDILDQSEPTFRAILGKSVNIGFFTGETKDGAGADIVFATFQTMREWKHAFFPDEFNLITVDEAHHSQANTFRDVIEYFTGASLLGLTAMRDRMDGKDIAEIFGEPVVQIPLEEAIVKGFLNPFEYRMVSDGLNGEAIKKLTQELKNGKRFTLSDVNKRLFIEARDEEIVRRVVEEAGSRKTLVFCRNIRHANRITEMFGSSARAYHSGATRAVNRDMLKAFRAGSIQYLVAVNKANEGVDIPDAEVVVFLRTTESKNVFFQQLGRSLRKLQGKGKSLILDFVGNVERLTMIQDLVRIVGQNLDLFHDDEKEVVSVSGDGFSFDFCETLVEILDLIARIRRDFYPTWQEASVAAIAMGLKVPNEYRRQYKRDPRLPAAPHEFYQDQAFPGYLVFFGGEKRPDVDYYSTWQEAAAAAQKLSIRTGLEYRARFKEDPRLYSSPWISYRDFPGFGKFLKKREKYATWQEASKAALNLGIRTYAQYKRRFREDPLLRSDVRTYDEFPGFKIFLDHTYSSWQEAAVATQKLGIKRTADYTKRFKEDPKLPAAPWVYYPDYPGWQQFLVYKGKSS